MYSQALEVTWARGIGPLPTTASSAGVRVTGFCRALFLPAIVRSPFKTIAKIKNSHSIQPVLGPVFVIQILMLVAGAEQRDRQHVAIDRLAQFLTGCARHQG